MRGLLQYLKPTLPPVAVLMEPGAVFALRVGSAQRDPTPLVRHEESFESPDGHYLPGPEAMEVLSASLMTQLGSPKRISCIIGDPLFKTQVLTLSDFPRSEQERRKVILWHIRKFLNYPIDSVRMDYAIIGRVPGSVKLLVTLCSRRRRFRPSKPPSPPGAVEVGSSWRSRRSNSSTSRWRKARCRQMGTP